jgi:hypothetical protein
LRKLRADASPVNPCGRDLGINEALRRGLKRRSLALFRYVLFRAQLKSDSNCNSFLISFKMVRALFRKTKKRKTGRQAHNKNIGGRKRDAPAPWQAVVSRVVRL